MPLRLRWMLPWQGYKNRLMRRCKHRCNHHLGECTSQLKFSISLWTISEQGRRRRLRQRYQIRKVFWGWRTVWWICTVGRKQLEIPEIGYAALWWHQSGWVDSTGREILCVLSIGGGRRAWSGSSGSWGWRSSLVPVGTSPPPNSYLGWPQNVNTPQVPIDPSGIVIWTMVSNDSIGIGFGVSAEFYRTLSSSNRRQRRDSIRSLH